MVELINNSLRRDKCPLCESDNIFPVGNIKYEKSFSSTQIELKKTPEYWHCRDCNSGFTQHIINEQDSKRLYSSNKKNKWLSSNFQEEKTDDLIKNISSYLKPNINVLDVGCNTGELLDFVAAKGAITYGLEYSELGMAESRKKNHTVFNDLNQITQNNFFDIIFAFDLVEHLYDVNEFINKCYNLLKISGLLIILTGDSECLSARLAKNKWWYVTYPEHIVFPSQEFYKRSTIFQVEKIIPVFNSRAYEKKYLFYFDKLVYKKIMSFFWQLMKFSYTGLPSVSKDHNLIILKKK